MAKTFREHTSNGVQTVYPVDFTLGYLGNRDYVYVYTGSDYTTQLAYTWVDDSNIELDAPLPNLATFTLRRIVPRDKIVNNYEDDARVAEKELDQSFLQAVMLFEEVEDGFMAVVSPWIVNGDIDMAGNDILNLASIQAEDIKNAAGDSLLALAQQYSDAAALSASNASSSATAAGNSATLANDRVGYASEWANNAEDVLVSAAAGGDEVDDYSAKHHAAKAAASAASIPANVLVPTDIGVTVQAHDATILKGADIGTSVQAYDVDTAKTDVTQTFSAPQRGAVVTANTASYDMDLGNNFKTVLPGSNTVVFTNLAEGQSGNIWFDNSGGYLIAAAATILISASDLNTINSAGVYSLSYYCDGTNVQVTTSPSLTVGGA